jgi:hypothetical protein
MKTVVSDTPGAIRMEERFILLPGRGEVLVRGCRAARVLPAVLAKTIAACVTTWRVCAATAA